MRCSFDRMRWVVAALSVAFASAVFAAGERGAKVVDAEPAEARGKAGSGVVVQHSAPARIGVGETVAVQLRFSGVTANDGAVVEVRDPSTRETLASISLAPREARTIEVPYTGRDDGMQFIDVATTQAGQTTVQSVPLRVGSGQVKLKRAGTKRAVDAGGAVISMPAVEVGAKR